MPSSAVAVHSCNGVGQAYQSAIIRKLRYLAEVFLMQDSVCPCGARLIEKANDHSS